VSSYLQKLTAKNTLITKQIAWQRKSVTVHLIENVYQHSTTR